MHKAHTDLDLRMLREAHVHTRGALEAGGHVSSLEPKLCDGYNTENR